jgi:hypothetical protein
MKIVKDNEPTLPSPPEFGSTEQDRPVRFSKIYDYPTGVKLGFPALPDLTVYGWTASMAEGRSVIEFGTFNLRPHEVHKLPRVPLLVAADPLTPVSIKWEATATNVNGAARGTLTTTVSPSTFSGDWMN